MKRLSKEHRRKLTLVLKKRWENPVYRAHMSAIRKGKIPKNFYEMREKSWAMSKKEERNSNWKGQSVGYRGLHRWVQRYLGNPTTCEICGRTNLLGKLINWANKSRRYKRDLNDWIRICAKCHKRYDGLTGCQRKKIKGIWKIIKTI